MTIDIVITTIYVLSDIAEQLHHYYYTTTSIQRPFFQDNLGKPAPET